MAMRVSSLSTGTDFKELKQGRYVSDFHKNHTKFLGKFNAIAINRIWLVALIFRQPSPLYLKTASPTTSQEKLEEAELCSLFPYHPLNNGQATLSEDRFSPTSPSDENPSKPLFLINIPVGRLPGSRLDPVAKIEKLLTEESFGADAKFSKKEAKKKLAVVMGVNQIKSIDAAVNRQFQQYIEGKQLTGNIPCRVFGFHWEPQWKKELNWRQLIRRVEKLQIGERVIKFKKFTERELQEGCYSKEKAFFILNFLDPEKAALLRRDLEGNKEGLSSEIASQIPYKQIRERILHDSCTQDFGKLFHEQAEGPSYFVTMDSDTRYLLGLRLGIQI